MGFLIGHETMILDATKSNVLLLAKALVLFPRAIIIAEVGRRMVNGSLLRT